MLPFTVSYDFKTPFFFPPVGVPYVYITNNDPSTKVKLVKDTG